jgi:hypothetical protein
MCTTQFYSKRVYVSYSLFPCTFDDGCLLQELEKPDSHVFDVLRGKSNELYGQVFMPCV